MGTHDEWFVRLDAELRDGGAPHLGPLCPRTQHRRQHHGPVGALRVLADQPGSMGQAADGSHEQRPGGLVCPSAWHCRWAYGIEVGSRWMCHSCVSHLAQSMCGSMPLWMTASSSVSLVMKTDEKRSLVRTLMWPVGRDNTSTHVALSGPRHDSGRRKLSTCTCTVFAEAQGHEQESPR